MKYPEIASRFNYVLNLRGLKAKELSDKTGINKASISQYVNGNHCPSNEKAKILGDILRVNPLWLMGFDVSMELPKGDKEVHANLLKFYEVFKEYEMLKDSDKEIINQMIKSLASKTE